MSGIVGGNLGRGSGLIKAGAIDDNSVTLAKMAGLARGKLIYGDVSGDPAALAAGGADEVLTHDGTDFDWAAAAGGGKVLQVVSASTSTLATTTSTTTWAALVPELDITPSADTSKILVMWTDNNIYCNSTVYYHLTIMRDTSTNLGHATYGNIIGYGAYDDPSGTPAQCSAVILDDPATTSSVNYCVYGRTVDGTTLYTSNGATCYITAMEIGA